MPASLRASLVDEEIRAERGHPDIRIARRAETILRLAVVARERGEGTDGLRRVLVVQAVRLACISAERLAYAEERPGPAADAINMNELVGTVLVERSDPLGETDTDEPELDVRSLGSKHVGVECDLGGGLERAPNQGEDR